MNGKAFVPDNSRDITAIYQQGILILGADAELDDTTIGMGLNLREQPIRSQTYLLGPMWSNGVEFIGSACRYEYENIIEGTLTITYFDDEEYIISGTFEFVTATEGCDTIRVTDGRFDIPYIP